MRSKCVHKLAVTGYAELVKDSHKYTNLMSTKSEKNIHFNWESRLIQITTNEGALQSENTQKSEKGSFKYLCKIVSENEYKLLTKGASFTFQIKS